MVAGDFALWIPTLFLAYVADARREWDAVAATCTRPDPELAELLDETRSKLQAAQAMRGERER